MNMTWQKTQRRTIRMMLQNDERHTVNLETLELSIIVIIASNNTRCHSQLACNTA